MKNKILLADDDRSVRKSLSRALESEGFDVLTVEDGRAAVREFIAEAPDLVLLDLNMPDKDGWEAFDLIETLHSFVPVIIITARPNQFGRAKMAGADALMEKPLDLPLLLQTVNRLLKEPDNERLARMCSSQFVTEWLPGELAASSPE
jgi:DNA-binding response OmpR family regulator